MAYDIAGSLQTPQLYTPAMAQRNALANQAMRMDNELTKQSMEAAKADAEASQRINEAYTRFGGDLEKTRNYLVEAGAGMGAVGKIEGMIAERGKQQADSEKARLDAATKKLELGSQLVGAATDQNSWNAVRQRGVELGVWSADQVPEQYDPARIKMMQENALSLKDRLDMQRADLAERRYALQEQNIASLIADRGRSGGGDSGGSKWKVDLDRGVRYDDQGNVEPLPGGAIPKPETAQERAARMKMEQENRLADKDFENSKDAAARAQGLFDGATGSGAGKLRDETAAFFGKTTEGAQKAAQLKVLAGKLVAAVPKFSGPQSDADVKLYREMAGQVGDESLPTETRKAALQTVIDLQTAEAKRRKEAASYGQSSAGSQQTTKTEQPSGGQLSATDQQALEWANQNPTDPRAQAIKRRLGF